MIDFEKDEKDKLSLFTSIKSICDNINKSLGNVNNLEPIITEKNTIKIIDQTKIPGIKTIATKLKINFEPNLDNSWLNFILYNIHLTCFPY